MLKTITLVFLLFLSCFAFSQNIPVQEASHTIKRSEKQTYYFTLKKGYGLKAVLMQKGIAVDVSIYKVNDTTLIKFFDSNDFIGPLPIFFESSASGKYQLIVRGQPVSINPVAGDYTIKQEAILSPVDIVKLNQEKQKEKDDFLKWLTDNSHPIQSVDAGSDMADLQPLKTILKDVQVVGLGEATHGTSEFARVKHRILEFLVKEMGYKTFFIEAPMNICREINNYVLYGKGDLDTVTVRANSLVMRVQEVKDMIKWMYDYNKTQSADKKATFLGFDPTYEIYGWKELKQFYNKVDTSKLALLDTLKKRGFQISQLTNKTDSVSQKKFKALYPSYYLDCSSVLKDIVMNEGRYKYLAGSEIYEKSLQDIKQVIEAAEVYKNENYNSNMRDYYMTENVMNYLQNAEPGTKVILWAHNGHMAKFTNQYFTPMGYRLGQLLKDKYYSFGFEFYSGDFLTYNIDLNRLWSVMSVGIPPEGSLSSYLNKTGKENLFIDFRNTSSKSIKLFAKDWDIHNLEASYSVKNSAFGQIKLDRYDGLIYIKKSTATKNLNLYVHYSLD